MRAFCVASPKVPYDVEMAGSSKDSLELTVMVTVQVMATMLEWVTEGDRASMAWKELKRKCPSLVVCECLKALR